MFNVIRLPTKFSRIIKRYSQKEKSELLDILIKIWDWESVMLPDNSIWDTISLIYGEWMNMESKNGNKPKTSLILDNTELVVDVVPSDSDTRVEYSRVEDNRIEENKIDITKVIETEVSSPTFWKQEINDTLSFLQKSVWIDEFKESVKRQRVYWNH